MDDKTTFFTQAEALRDLTALEEIERDPGVSQRELANHMGVSLGVANACIRALVRKGLVKIRGENNRSITYHLTKQGMLRKSLLAMEWTKNTIDFYAQGRRRVSERLCAVAAQGIATVAYYGVGELTEIALVVAAESGLQVVAVVDAQGRCGVMLGVPLGGTELVEEHLPEAVIICDDTDMSGIAAIRATGTPILHLMADVDEEA